MAFTLEIPESFALLKLPPGVHSRLHALLDKQDEGTPLTAAEREEAEGLVEIAEFLTWMRLRIKGGRSATAD